MSHYSQHLNAFNKLMLKSRESVTFTRETDVKDAQGVITSSSSVSDTIFVRIQKLSEEDRKITGRGVSVEGFMKMYAYTSYDMTNNGSDIEIEVGDIITRTETEGAYSYRVETIVGKWEIDNSIVHKKYLLRKIVA